MKKGLSRQVKVGVFGLSMAVLLYLGINFIKSKKIFNSDNIFYAEYSQADGIEVSSPVLVKGFRVGTVDKITFDIHKSTVIVKMSVDDEYPIPNDSKAKITSASILGGKVIEIILGSSPTPLESGDNLVPQQEQGILEMASNEYENLKAQASGLIDQLSKALKSVNALLSEQNVANVSSTLANINKVSGNLDNIISNQKNNIEGTLANLNGITKSLNSEIPKLGITLDNFNQLSASLAKDGPILIHNASLAVENLNSLLSKVQNPEGTVGKLLSEDEVYQNLTNATNALTLLLEDIKTNPKRYINISVFGKKDKVEKK